MCLCAQIGVFGRTREQCPKPRQSVFEYRAAIILHNSPHKKSRGGYPGANKLSHAPTTKKMKPGATAARRRSHLGARAPEGVSAVPDTEKVLVLDRIFELDIHFGNGDCWVIACPPPGIIIVFNAPRGCQNVSLRPNWSARAHPRAATETTPGRV